MAIKETMDVLDAINATSDTIQSVMSDGKLGLTDIPKIIALFKPYNTAITGLSQVPTEIKGLSPEEMELLTTKAIETLLKFATTVIGVVELK